jgi:hypothetical protein
LPYTSLDPDKILATADRLSHRIGERFSGSGLEKVGAELVDLAGKTRDDANTLAEPIWWLRIVLWVLLIAGALVFFLVGRFLTFDRISTGAFDFVQGVEASINTLVLAGIGFVTLAKAEERVKRVRVMAGLHKLRSLIHIIDMHQLTKDPIMLSGKVERTLSSPEHALTPHELERYLNYCSEMLAITGKLAALYAQSVQDMEVVDAVNDVESLGANLSRKIWQKIMLVGLPEEAGQTKRKSLRK